MEDAPAEKPAPSAVGTLADRPFVHLLVYARNRRLTGRLELHAGGGLRGFLELWRGRICDARTVPAVAYFGPLAYELGYIDSATLDATLFEIAKSKRLHGEVLVERGSLTPKGRDHVLNEQMCRKVHHFSTLPVDATFAFYEARPTLEEPSFTLDPIQPAWRSLRERPPVESVREVLTRFANATLRLANEGPMTHAGLEPEETLLCESLMWKPMTLSQLRAASQLTSDRLDLLVYLLVITKCVESVPAQASSASPSSMAAVGIRAPLAPSVVKGSVQRAAGTRTLPGMARVSLRPGAVDAAHPSLSFRVPSSPPMRASSGTNVTFPASLAPVLSPAEVGAIGIEHRASVIADEDPFTALSLGKGASIEAARASYFRLAKLWHPDRLPADLAPFRMEVERVFECMTRAHRTLTDPDARREYLANGAVTKLASDLPQKRPRAEVLREIELALTKREFRHAESAAQDLARADVDDADAHALAAWAMTLAGEASGETLRAAVQLLDRAVNRDRDCERALYYRGLLHKRLDNAAHAFRDFARVVALNPKHVDAHREIRIFEMRARNGSGEHAISSLFQKVKRKE